MMNFFKINLKLLLRRIYPYSLSSDSLKISHTVSLRNTKIYVLPGARLEIGENVRINNTMICIEKGVCKISEGCIIGNSSKNLKTNIIINDGSLYIDHHTKLSLSRIWIRFGGKCQIGSYTNINEGSEIRCDDSIKIGSYNQISYGVKIWDTNTHNLLLKNERRELTEQYYPYYGYEKSKPKTSPIIIGDDCWIGEKASLLKGTKLGNEVICGYNCFLSGQDIPDNSQVVSKVILDVKSRI